MTQMNQYLSAKETNKILKRQLREAFPGVKFSCRMSRGTGYGSVHIRWVDGPTVDEVREISQPFQGKTFDGMTDSTIYMRKVCAMSADGKPLLSGLGYVFEEREISDESLQACAWEIDAAGYVPSRMAARMIANGETVEEAARYCCLAKKN